MRILLSNDDGINAKGIWALHDALADHAEILVVAPEREQSASSHALTMHHPLRLRQLDERVFAVDGTPSDCVLMAVRGLGGKIDFVPDFVLSGINHGANLGDDVTYSGTVAAAFEGHLLGFPSVAFSLASGTGDFGLAAAAARELVLQLAARERVPTLLLNVNFPDSPEYRGLRVTSLGHRRYEDVIDERTDPRGKTYYWIGGSPSWDDDPRSDMAALKDGFVSMTPLHLALTDVPMVETIGTWGLSLQPNGSKAAE
ncbi:MAG: 5'/3'-nucleotidase SurE [Candidatus Eisenbacteria bacterium]|nr:5'/3'-nucleotidase SurE [Candidatus Eisenbacteria bacterium]